jgi:hypothetical protein
MGRRTDFGILPIGDHRSARSRCRAPPAHLFPHLKVSMEKKYLPLSSLLLAGALSFAPAQAKPDAANASEPVIQVALLLDTSNSMDGLIDQAKSRLWSVVNSMTALRHDGRSPRIEIALYEYGNDSLSGKDNWVRQVAPLTPDLDLISEKLFSLRTNGGSEYVGAVVKNATDALEWKSGPKTMKIIYIAGNESFAQGRVSYKEAIGDAREKKIHINTIYCGERQEGIKLEWQAGADLANGKYFSIDANRKSTHVDTPYDAELKQLNLRLNDTYYGYGAQGSSRKANQRLQDSNASGQSESVLVERSVSKSNSALYRNGGWDIVDRAQDDPGFLDKATEAELPPELRGMSPAQKRAFVAQKKAEREALKARMAELAQKREAFIRQAGRANADGKDDDLGQAIEQSVMEMAAKSGFTAKSP